MEKENQNGILTLDVFQTKKDIIIRSTIAGVPGKDLDISITSDKVTIKGERKDEQSEESKEYYYRELYWGGFERSIILPEEVNSDEAKATLKNGILTIRLPKLSKEKKVEVA